MINVVMLGGGTGLSNLLSSCKELNLNITAGVVVSDNGGSTGKIRDFYNIPAPGDLRKTINCCIDDKDLNKLMEYRFDDKLEEHTIGNLILTALVNIKGDIALAVEEYRRIFNIKEKIFPITNQSNHLIGLMEDGEIVYGESEITSYNAPVKKVMYDSAVIANKDIVQAIKEADFVIISPGSLYTSTIPNLIISDILSAIKKSSAKVIYISNIMTQQGETTSYNVSDHITAIEKHSYSGIIDYVIANDYYDVSEELRDNYKKEGSELVVLDKANINSNTKIISQKMIKEGKYIRHDISKVRDILKDIMEV